MSTLDQYLNLYKENRSLINENSAPALNALREGAFGTLSSISLPDTRHEDYAFTDLDKILAPDFGLNLARVAMDFNPLESFKCNVPDLSTALFFLENDCFVSGEDSYDAVPEGVIVGSLREVALRYPEIIERYYGSVASGKNPLVALNTLLAQDGFVVYVPDGVKLGCPLQLVSIFQSPMPLMGVRRILIVLGKGSAARVIACDHTRNPHNDYLALQTVEIHLAEDSMLEYCEIEESSERTVRLSSLYLNQLSGSHARINGITLFNGSTRNEYYCRLAGAHASLDISGLGIEDCARRLDVYSHISHEATDCRSNELFKYVADDKSLAAFSGRILVHEGAVGTEAYQSNRNLLGNPDARIYSKPQLEIYNDDVKCSHGCATGKLDDMQLFYMRARGIDEADARTMLKQAFMADVLERVAEESMRDRLRSLVEQRFLGRISPCASCAANCPVSRK